MSEFITKVKRTHYCGDLRSSHEEKEVVLMGWVHRRRDLGGVIFIDLRDREGIAQVVLNPKVHSNAHQIRNEFVLAIKGTVELRPEGMINNSMKTGKIEVIADDVEILNESQTPPFLTETVDDVSENLRLKYRYLDLRREDIQQNLILRSRVALETRNYLQKQGFVEIETPFLTKSTPEGARDYLVPSRIHAGMFYALPQSPQLFKQLLMVSGFDKYYQIVKCFRDEDLRADRQPEFTQIDMEMSFISEEDVISAVEGLMAHIFKKGINRELQIPIPRMTYKEAIDRYGKDNPDIRFSLEFKDLTDIVRYSKFKVFSDVAADGGIIKAIKVDDGKRLSRKDLDGLADFVKSYGAKGLAWARINEDGWTSPIFKFLSQVEVEQINTTMEAKAGNVILFISDAINIVHESLGNLRTHLARKLELIDPNELAFTWITEFPMFEYNEKEKRFVATHHPFTSPMTEDINLIETDPAHVRDRAYDLVLNGAEIGGGSIRIHNYEVQLKILKALGLQDNEIRAKFGFLIDALQYGAPPHGGIAFGLDRIIMIMAGAESLREVIAFPKTNRATCLLTDAPSTVSLEQLNELSLKIV